MVSRELLEAQGAVELPAREMLSMFEINIVAPVVIQNNISVQVCGVGYQNTATCSNVQANVGDFTFNWGG